MTWRDVAVTQHDTVRLLAWRSRKELYARWSSVTPRSTAHTTKGRMALVEGLTVMVVRAATAGEGSITWNTGACLRGGGRK